MKKLISLSLLAYTSLFADAELDAIRAQLQQQKLITQKLEAKLNELEHKTQKQSAKIAKIETKNTNQSASFSQNAYMPDMAFVLNMSALGRNVKNGNYENYAIPGFVNTGDAEIPFNKDDGLNFNYAEVALHSTVDPYFDAFAVFHISPAAFEIEEAYVKTRALPYGLQVKAGKFKSAFGRINQKHHHVWQFDSQPIIYEALFGPDAISDAGIQAQWVAPTDTYIMAGVEAYAGTNGSSFGASSENKHLYVGYLKSSVDIGENLSVLAGVSAAHGSNFDATTNLTNPTNIYGADVTLREQLGSYSSLIWQSEFLQRDKDVTTVTTRTDKQSGLYSELIYQYNNNWSTGVRYDTIIKNDTDLSAYTVDTNNLERYTAKIDYHPFPMSRLRLQYTHDRTKVIAGERKNINEVSLSLNIAAGAHGAHDY